MLKRAKGIFAAGTIVVAGSLVLAACILADPPAEVERVSRRPIILRESANPPPTKILRDWPPPLFEFAFYVDADPTLSVAWEAFFDYDPATQNQPSLPSGHSDPDPTRDDAGIRKIGVTRSVPEGTRCHTFEILVAYDFVDSHVPDNRGGDSIVWFYAPTGDLSTCPAFDASVPDASDDADTGIFVPGGQDEGG